MTTFFFPHPQTHITYASMVRPVRARDERRRLKEKALERWENEGGSVPRFDGEGRVTMGAFNRKRNAMTAASD